MLKSAASRIPSGSTGSFILKAWMLAMLFGLWGVQTAYAGITIQPTTWNVVGLDSNNVNAGPNTFPVGARVCNTGATAVTNVSATFVWDSFNTYITLSGASTLNVPSLAAGECVDFYFPVTITRTTAAYNAARQYHITVTGDSVASVTTPIPREVYVEKLVSQNRNSVSSITGPTTVYVGQIYNYTVSASTATQGYEQLEAFLELSNIIFQVQSINTTYTAPSGATNDKFYSDACGWDNNPLSGSYRSCIGPVNYPGGKAGGTVVTTYTVKVLTAGTTTAGTMIYDFSGSSYHYNSDYGAITITITALEPLPDLTITKSHSGNFTQGEVGATYTITASNSGIEATSGTVTVTDTLPAGLTATAMSGTGWTCVLGSLACTRSDALASGASYPPITLTVTVANNAPASVTNSVAVSGGGETNTANNTATDPTTITQLPDLTVDKSHTGNFTQGEVGATYSIVVTNSGFADTSGTVTVTDTLPAELTATNIAGPGWSCVLATLTCTRDNPARPPGGSFSAITVTVNVAANAPPDVTNSVTVSGGGQTNTTNDTATDPTTVIQLPDLTITKSHIGNFTQGQVGATYSITATNSGSTPTSGTVTVTDTLPADLTATAISGSGWSCVLGTLTCTRSDALAGGASYPVITLTVDVANNAPASVTNTANVSGGGQIITTNDSASDPTTVIQLPDLTIAKSHIGNFTQGQVGATYSITATNSGSAPTSGVVTVTDTLPASLTATAISGSGWSCVLGTLTCTRNDALAAGSSYPVITLTVDVSLTAPGSVTNSAAVSGGGETNVSNNSANDPTTIDTAAPPDVSLVKSVSPNGVQLPGTDLDYTIGYTNAGGQPANNFVIVDPNMANADPLERVLHNVDFKVGSLTSTPGTTGLVATFEYSNDGGTTWTYTPVSAGGGAPAGYDRLVTNVRWSFAGTLSAIAPNNTGSVGFTVRIR